MTCLRVNGITQTIPCFFRGHLTLHLQTFNHYNIPHNAHYSTAWYAWLLPGCTHCTLFIAHCTCSVYHMFILLLMVPMLHRLGQVFRNTMYTIWMIWSLLMQFSWSMLRATASSNNEVHQPHSELLHQLVIQETCMVMLIGNDATMICMLCMHEWYPP